MWKVLFLGIKDAVWLFTCMLKPIRVYLSSKGVPVLTYLDDNMVKGSSEAQCQENQAILVETLSRAGFVVSKSKSKGPLSRINFLGLEVCSSSLKFFIPLPKLERIEKEIEEMLSSSKVKLRTMAKFLGLMQSVSRALGNIVRLRTRLLYSWMNNHLISASYNHYFPLSWDEREELSFWLYNVRELNGFFFSPDLSCSETKFTVVSDASDSGMFAFQFEDKYEVILRKRFSAEEYKSSSTFRELSALSHIYSEAVGDRFCNASVTHLTDNKAVCSIMEFGSRKKHLMQLALKIFSACRQKKIDLFVEWRPRSNALLEHADLGSKSFDESAYSLNFDSFMLVLNFFQVTLEIDVMSNYWNRKSQIFYSKTLEYGSSGVNFFAQKLFDNVMYYAFPPPGKIVPTILHFSKFNAHGLMIIPVWKSASYWFRVVPDGRHFSSYVRKFLPFKPTGFVYDDQVLSTTFKNPCNFEMVAVLFDFSNRNMEDIFMPNVRKDFCIADFCDKCS